VAWASVKSYQRKDAKDAIPPNDLGNARVDLHAEKRSNQRHVKHIPQSGKTNSTIDGPTESRMVNPDQGTRIDFDAVDGRLS
jgi:hypothetical protein